MYAPTADPCGRSTTTEDFDPGAGVDTVQTVGRSRPGRCTIAVQWAEPWGGATTDLAVDVYEIVAGVPSYAFTEDTNNLATGIPEEYVSFSDSGGDLAVRDRDPSCGAARAPRCVK